MCVQQIPSLLVILFTYTCCVPGFMPRNVEEWKYLLQLYKQACSTKQATKPQSTDLDLTLPLAPPPTPVTPLPSSPFKAAVSSPSSSTSSSLPGATGREVVNDVDGLPKGLFAGVGGNSLSVVSEAAYRLTTAVEVEESEDADHLAHIGKSFHWTIGPFALDHPTNPAKVVVTEGWSLVSSSFLWKYEDLFS